MCVFFFNFAGLDKIEFLQSHENQDIYQRAFEIIEHYFSADEEDEKLAPDVDQAAQQFNFNPQDNVQGFEF